MAVRSTMAALIAEVRLLINDPSDPLATPPVVPVFSDQEVQDALDHTREDMRYLPLAGPPTIADGGTVTWLDYYAMVGSVGIGDWEDDVLLAGNHFQTLTPATTDNLVGHWTFSANTLPPVYLVGKTYDRFYAAAEILKKWAATRTLYMRFSTDGQSFTPTDIRAALMDQAKAYLCQARVGLIQMVRQDIPRDLGTIHAFDFSQTRF